jgi:type VI secretion system protein ImpH
VADDALAHYAGALQQRVVSAPQLQRLLADYFGVPVQLQSFAGRWFPVEAANQSRLGLGAVTLGQDALVGERLWQRDLRVRLTLGPSAAPSRPASCPAGRAQSPSRSC